MSARAQGERSGRIAMTKQEKRRLVKEIAAIAEKAYRRGFQHGHYTALHNSHERVPTDAEVYKWRFATHSKTNAVCPPGTSGAGRRDDIYERLDMELESHDSPIRHLLYETDLPKKSI